MSEKRFQITLTETQVKALCAACEDIARLDMGQLDVLERVDANWGAMRCVREMLFPEGHSVTGIRKMSEDGKVLWDLYQALRFQLAWAHQDNAPHERRWPEQIQVHFDVPMKTGSEPLPEIEIKTID